MLKRLTILFGMLLVFCIATIAQPTLSLETYGVSPRDVEEDTENFFEYPYNGLTSVGLGTMVYLKVTTDSSFNNPSWTLPTSPATSQATFGDEMAVGDNTIYVKFTPDISGRYVIEFGDFGVTTEITLNAAEYPPVTSQIGPLRAV